MPKIIEMKKSGFTLLEFIIGMTAGVAIALVAVFLFAPVDNWVYTQSRRSGTSENSAAMMRMLKEIRRIKTPGQIQIFDADHLQFIDIDDQTVDFQKSGTDLLRDADVLARNVQGLTFSYMDEEGNVTTDVGEIRVVRVELVTTSGAQTIRLQSSARIRNLP